jgi:hypothetical protein
MDIWVNGQRIEVVGELAITPMDDGWPTIGGQPVAGLTRCEDITIEGMFMGTNQRECAICGSVFTLGPEGECHLSQEATGFSLGPVCHACGTAVVAPSE